MTTARRPSLRPALPAAALALTLAASFTVATAAEAVAAKPAPQFEPSGAGRCLPGSDTADATFWVTAGKGRWAHVDARYLIAGDDWTELPGHPARMDISNGWIAVRLESVPADAQSVTFAVMAVDRKGVPAGSQGWVESAPFECWSPGG